MYIFRNIIYIIRIFVVIFICMFTKTPRNRGEYLAKALEKLGPSFIKFGQALSVRGDVVGDEVAKSLSRLQDKMSPFSTKKAIATIEKELGSKLNDVFAEFEGKSVAAASIAQVHKGVTKDGEVVAIKILRPGIEKKFKRDIDLLYFVAKIISKFSTFKRLRLIEVIDVFADTVRKELDLRIEAACASELRENCKNDEAVYIPKVFWEYNARRVMVLEWVDGIPINDKEALLKAGHDLQVISERLAITFLNQTFRDGFFHADIHPGNLFVDKAGNIVQVDFGIMGSLDKKTRIYVAEILRGFLSGDYQHVAQVHFDAGYVNQDKSVHDFALACRAIGEPIMGLPANKVSIAKLLTLLFKVTEDFEMSTQPQLILLQKTMVLIEGVGQSLYPEANMWQMADGWIKEWAKNNLGPSAMLKDGLKDLLSIFKTLPQRLKELDKVISELK